MKALIEKAYDLEELSRYLSELNNREESHIGYCGHKEEEIYETLKRDFVNEEGDSKFLISKNSSGAIVAAIGLDIDETVAEVWGPFNKGAEINLQLQLWESIVRSNPIVTDFYFFINKENEQQQRFMSEINAKKTGEHLILDVKARNFNKVREMRSIAYQDSDYGSFEKLHSSMFPNTYYDASTIVKRLGNGNVLRVLKNENNELLGYAYFEIDCEHGDASLEYISIAEKARNQGLGTLVLREALTEMFSYPGINEIRLTVENKSNQANHVYKKAGFEQKHILVSYHYQR